MRPRCARTTISIFGLSARRIGHLADIGGMPDGVDRYRRVRAVRLDQHCRVGGSARYGGDSPLAQRLDPFAILLRDLGQSREKLPVGHRLP